MSFTCNGCGHALPSDEAARAARVPKGRGAVKFVCRWRCLTPIVANDALSLRQVLLPDHVPDDGWFEVNWSRYAQSPLGHTTRNELQEMADTGIILSFWTEGTDASGYPYRRQYAYVWNKVLLEVWQQDRLKAVRKAWALKQRRAQAAKRRRKKQYVLAQQRQQARDASMDAKAQAARGIWYAPTPQERAWAGYTMPTTTTSPVEFVDRAPAELTWPEAPQCLDLAQIISWLDSYWWTEPQVD